MASPSSPRDINRGLLLILGIVGAIIVVQGVRAQPAPQPTALEQRVAALETQQVYTSRALRTLCALTPRSTFC